MKLFWRGVSWPDSAVFAIIEKSKDLIYLLHILYYCNCPILDNWNAVFKLNWRIITKSRYVFIILWIGYYQNRHVCFLFEKGWASRTFGWSVWHWHSTQWSNKVHIQYKFIEFKLTYILSYLNPFISVEYISRKNPHFFPQKISHSWFHAKVFILILNVPVVPHPQQI